MKAQKTMIAVGVTLALAASYAQAATNEDYKKVVVYGEVTLDKDSAHEWGPWTQFEAPAAGPAPVAPTLVALTPEIPPEILNPPLIPPTPPPTTPYANVCQAGDWCGYSVATRYTENSSTRTHMNSFSITHEESDGIEFATGSGYGFAAFHSRSFDGSMPDETTSGDENKDGYYYNTLSDFYSSTHREGTDTNIRSDRPNPPNLNSPIIAFEQLSRYLTSGYYTISEGESENGVYGNHVVVVPTSVESLQGLNAGNKIASYTGATVLGQTPLEFYINFGTGLGGGSVNHGRSDLDTLVQINTSEGPQLVGRTGYDFKIITDSDGIKITDITSADINDANESISGYGAITCGGPACSSTAVGTTIEMTVNRDVAGTTETLSGTNSDVGHAFRDQKLNLPE